MEKPDLESSIKYYENKLKNIHLEYEDNWKCDWPKIREKELYFRREIYRLSKLKKNEEEAMAKYCEEQSKKEAMAKYCEKQREMVKQNIPMKKESNIIINAKEKESNTDNKESVLNNEENISEEEQWEINNKLLQESYEEEDEEINIENQTCNDNDSIESIENKSLYNLNTAIEAMDIDLGKQKRKRDPYGESSVRSEGEFERPSRAYGQWPPEKEDYPYNYIPGQYKYMGSRRREFEKTVKFQNHKSDGAILNLSAHDPIDWPNIISIWKGLIVQKYIQNQHNIGNKVEDMITYLETFLGESAKMLWEQWVDNNTIQYEELKRAGSNPYNFANIISQIIIAEDPELGCTTLQNERLREIEKLTLTNWKGIKEFSQHYLYNATTAKQGYSKGIVERYFNKLPDPLGSMIYEEYKKETEGCVINISQAITFVFKQLKKICTNIQAQRSMKHSDYNFCNKIVQIPLTYGEERSRNKKYYKPLRRGNNNLRTRRRYFLRRSDNKAPFLHKRNVRRYNPRKNYDKTCRCFICNSPDHLSKTCPNKDQKRYSSKYEEQERVLIVDNVNENILVCDDEIKDDESIYSIIETDEVENPEGEEYDSSGDELELIDQLAGLKVEMMDQEDCKHDWIQGKGDYNIKCNFCIYYPSQENRATCGICLKQACYSCLDKNKQVIRREVELESNDRILSSRVRILENRVNNLEEELEKLKKKLDNTNNIIKNNEIGNIELNEQIIPLKGNIFTDKVSYISGMKKEEEDPNKDKFTKCNNKLEILQINPYKFKIKNKSKEVQEYISVSQQDMDKLSKSNKTLSSTPYEFLIPRISFKTEQILSCFNQDIRDLIWKKYAERQYRIFLDIQEYFMDLYKGKDRHQGLSINIHVLPLIHLDDKLIIKPHHKYLILTASINLKYFRSIQIFPNENISLQCLIDHGLVHAIYGSLQEILHSDLGKAIKEACKKLSFLQGKYRILFYSNPPKFTYPVRPASHDVYITKGCHAFPSIWPGEISQEYEELLYKGTNHDNWRIFSEAKEIEGNIKFDPQYYMIYQNKILKIFLREYNGSYGTITRGVGRIIKPDYGKDSQIRKEYKELLSWHELWQPDEMDTECAAMLDYEDFD